MSIRTHLKNIPGKGVKGKKIIFSVDDYGNIMLESRQARERLRKSGLLVDQNRFSMYDALETKDDLAELYDALTCVKDRNGKYAVWTQFCMTANIDFDSMSANGYTEYVCELLPDSFAKRPGYEGTWDLWQEGIKLGLIVPQFHGREHLNINYLMEGLKQMDKMIMANIENRSLAALPYRNESKVGFTEAFSFDDIKDVEDHKNIIADGLQKFAMVYGQRATHFNAPGAREHHSLEPIMIEHGIQFLDTDLIKTEHQGFGKYSKRFHRFGSKGKNNLTYLYRNCVFEPNLNKNIDWVDQTMREIEIAFLWGKPANISSHRVNFVGHIEQRNREYGLGELKRLLKKIVNKWPDVEFISTDEFKLQNVKLR